MNLDLKILLNNISNAKKVTIILFVVTLRYYLITK